MRLSVLEIGKSNIYRTSKIRIWNSSQLYILARYVHSNMISIDHKKDKHKYKRKKSSSHRNSWFLSHCHPHLIIKWQIIPSLGSNLIVKVIWVNIFGLDAFWSALLKNLCDLLAIGSRFSHHDLGRFPIRYIRTLCYYSTVHDRIAAANSALSCQWSHHRLYQRAEKPILAAHYCNSD